MARQICVSQDLRIATDWFYAPDWASPKGRGYQAIPAGLHWVLHSKAQLQIRGISSSARFPLLRCLFPFVHERTGLRQAERMEDIVWAGPWLRGSSCCIFLGSQRIAYWGSDVEWSFRATSILEQEGVIGPFSQLPPICTCAYSRPWDLKGQAAGPHHHPCELVF